MSPRPRTVSDAAILAATHRVIGRVGPNRLTLAEVAAEVGLAPATLVQRFGSRRELLLALVQSGSETVEECFARMRGDHASPLAALVEAATVLSRVMRTPAEIANGLAFLQMDVTDPDFQRLAEAHARHTIEGYRRLLAEAVAAKELRPTDTARLARAVSAVAGGSLINWGMLQKGNVERWVREDLETLLAPLRTGRKAPARRRYPPTRKR